MNDKINHWCIICGTGYHGCDSCDATGINSWKKHTDTNNHYKIYLIVNDYTYGILNKIQAREKLSKCDITGWEHFLPNVSVKISEILSEDKPKRKRIKKDNI